VRCGANGIDFYVGVGNMMVLFLAILQTTKNMALMWRPDLKKYNAFLMSKTDEKAKKGDHAGLVFPLPTPISNAFQVRLC
jgi:hypothetical protein